MKIKVQRKINAPSEGLWKYLGDYSNIHRFNPLLKGSYFSEGSETSEMGSTRHCDLKGGDYIKERVIDWKEGSHYSIEIYETSMPVKNSKATLGVRSLGENQSEVYMNIEMEAKYRILAPMMYVMFKYIAAPGILRGLDKLYHKEQMLTVA